MGEAMHFTFICPECGNVEQVPQALIERETVEINNKTYTLMLVKCRRCENVFTAQVDDEKTLRLLGRSVAYMLATKKGGRERRRKSKRGYDKTQKELKERRNELMKKLNGKTIELKDGKTLEVRSLYDESGKK